MNEHTPTFATPEPRAWKRQILEAAAMGPTMVDPSTGLRHLLRYADIEALLNDKRAGGIGLAVFDQMGIHDGPLRHWYGGLMFTNEGVRHDRLRRLVIKAFTPRAVEQLRPLAAESVARRLATIRHDGGGDLVRAFAGLPMQVMCSVVGVPAADVPGFIAWVDALSPVFGFMEPAQIDAATAAISELLSYSRDLLERRTQTPADDLMTRLIRAEDGGDRLSREETVAMVANLLVGGHDTTASQIACTSLTLLSQPTALAELHANPGLIGPLLSETMRFEPSITVAPRTLVETIELSDIELPAGTLVMCNLLAANRDPSIWDAADEFVARRFLDPNAPRLLSFGSGPHYCLGAALARLTLEESLRGVAALSPKMVTDVEELRWVQVLGCSPAALAVTL